MKEKIEKLNVGEVIENIDVKDYTTYKVSCKVPCLVIPDSVESLITLLKFLKEEKIKYKIIGKGSNLIFVNNKYNGVLIRLDSFSNLEIDSNRITVGAGYPLIKLALRLSRLGFTGLEFAAGIPGSVGGAVYMNAGAYKSDMGYIVNSVKVLTPDYKVETIRNKELEFHYRDSFLKKNPDYICLEAELILKKANPFDILDVIEDRKQRRLESQPLEYPSAGSVFRNPTNASAGQIIEQLGLKGYKIGGAEVSKKHANFIINTGNATGKDIKELILKIKKEVKEQCNIDLTLEQEFVE
jgi:UDP-N-acetylmuramate dehydrogenase